jgi:hypothetical protein
MKILRTILLCAALFTPTFTFAGYATFMQALTGCDLGCSKTFTGTYNWTASNGYTTADQGTITITFYHNSTYLYTMNITMTSSVFGRSQTTNNVEYYPSTTGWYIQHWITLLSDGSQWNYVKAPTRSGDPSPFRAIQLNYDGWHWPECGTTNNLYDSVGCNGTGGSGYINNITNSLQGYFMVITPHKF